jgi:hypothetical protein
MFGLTLRVVTSDGEDEIGVSPRVIVEFERQFQTGIGRAFQQDQRVEHVYWMAWKASRSTKTFDDWLDGVLDVQIVEQDERPLSDSPSPGL